MPVASMGLTWTCWCYCLRKTSSAGKGISDLQVSLLFERCCKSFTSEDDPHAYSQHRRRWGLPRTGRERGGGSCGEAPMLSAGRRRNCPCKGSPSIPRGGSRCGTVAQPDRPAQAALSEAVFRVVPLLRSAVAREWSAAVHPLQPGGVAGSIAGASLHG